MFGRNDCRSGKSQLLYSSQKNIRCEPPQFKQTNVFHSVLVSYHWNLVDDLAPHSNDFGGFGCDHDYYLDVRPMIDFPLTHVVCLYHCPGDCPGLISGSHWILPIAALWLLITLSFALCLSCTMWIISIWCLHHLLSGASCAS